MSKIPNMAVEANLPQPDNIDGDIDELQHKTASLVIALNREIYDLKIVINRLINGEFGLVSLQPQTKEPITAQKVSVTLAYADGTNWDPGSGVGLYYWNGTVWKFIV